MLTILGRPTNRDSTFQKTDDQYNDTIELRTLRYLMPLTRPWLMWISLNYIEWNYGDLETTSRWPSVEVYKWSTTNHAWKCSDYFNRYVFLHHGRIPLNTNISMLNDVHLNEELIPFVHTFYEQSTSYNNVT